MSFYFSSLFSTIVILYKHCRRPRQAASVVSYSVQPHGLQPTRLPCPWDSPGKNTEWVASSFSINIAVLFEITLP